MEIKQLPIDQFIEDLASKSATPGGGSAAAIMGAMAAALVSMVSNLTLGKKKYLEVEPDMQALLQQSETLREQLLEMIRSDVNVFNQVMAAYALPRASEEDKTQRKTSLQNALKAATTIPLECAKLCRQVIDLSKIAAEKGNINVISDAGVAVLAAQAALKSAALNVYINVGNIEDETFVTNSKQSLELLLHNTDTLTEEIYQLVKSKL